MNSSKNAEPWWKRPTPVLALVLTVTGSITGVATTWGKVGWVPPNNIYAWREHHESGVHGGAMRQDVFMKWSDKKDCQRWKEQMGNLERDVIYAQERNSIDAERSAQRQLQEYEAAYLQKKCAVLLMSR